MIWDRGGTRAACLLHADAATSSRLQLLRNTAWVESGRLQAARDLGARSWKLCEMMCKWGSVRRARHLSSLEFTAEVHVTQSLRDRVNMCTTFARIVVKGKLQKCESAACPQLGV